MELLPAPVIQSLGKRTWPAAWELPGKATALSQVDRSYKGERLNQRPAVCPCTGMDLFLHFSINTLLKSLGFPYGGVCYCIGKPLPVHQLYSSLSSAHTYAISNFAPMQFQTSWNYGGVREEEEQERRRSIGSIYVTFYHWYSMCCHGSKSFVLHEQRFNFSLSTW